MNASNRTVCAMALVLTLVGCGGGGGGGESAPPPAPPVDVPAEPDKTNKYVGTWEGACLAAGTPPGDPVQSLREHNQVLKTGPTTMEANVAFHLFGTADCTGAIVAIVADDVKIEFVGVSSVESDTVDRVLITLPNAQINKWLWLFKNDQLFFPPTNPTRDSEGFPNQIDLLSPFLKVPEVALVPAKAGGIPSLSSSTKGAIHGLSRVLGPEVSAASQAR